MRLNLTAVASEALSGNIHFEIGQTHWGQASTGGALGADYNNAIKLKNAFLDWTPPQTDLKIRMGLQTMALPSFTTGDSQVFNADTAGIVFNYKFNDNVSLTALWARPYNDNSGQWRDNSRDTVNRNYMDNVDAGALLLPLSFDGVKVTP
ncbi:MAG: hypothetical protein LBO64_03145, partial [Desulfovibrio sp.]|nr:hypothetical protein [Desulfovibrio sp.]